MQETVATCSTGGGRSILPPPRKTVGVEKEVTSVISGSLPGTALSASFPPRRCGGWKGLAGAEGSCGSPALWGGGTRGREGSPGEAFAPSAQIPEKVQQEGGC